MGTDYGHISFDCLRNVVRGRPGRREHGAATAPVASLRERAGGQRVQSGGAFGGAADGGGDAVDGGDAFVLEGAEDGVLDEVGSALSDGVDESLVGLGDLGVEVAEVAVDLGLGGGGDGGEPRGDV